MKKTEAKNGNVAAAGATELSRKQFLGAFAALAVYSSPVFAALSCGGEDPDDDDDCSYSGSGASLSMSCDSGSTTTDSPCDGFTNDGICDEPEGTGFCPEGSDFADCV